MPTLTPNASPGRDESLRRYEYQWPQSGWDATGHWHATPDGASLTRRLPETATELAADSRWPAFFPSPICLVTATVDGTSVMEKVVGASIVNRFPYVVALSFCRENLSERHHVRRRFTDAIEQSRQVAIQYLPQGNLLDQAMHAVTATQDQDTDSRIARSGLQTRDAVTSDAPVFVESFMVYEARLASPAKTADGQSLYDPPWVDVGSHRVYFFEITAIQLREDIASGNSQIHWRSLPVWQPQRPLQGPAPAPSGHVSQGYQKPYTPHYVFPAAQTVAFESDFHRNGMAVKLLPPLPEDQIEVDNDRARWPCFFPSSVGMISTWSDDGTPNLMPCGSTTVLSRHPLVIAPCVSASAINERYAPRATLEFIRRNRRFVCGVPVIHDTVLDAIRYAGNTSLAQNRAKVGDAGLTVSGGDWGPLLPALPVQFECDVIGEVQLGTHVMFLGEVKRIVVRNDVTPNNPLQWCPWPVVVATPGASRADEVTASAAGSRR